MERRDIFEDLRAEYAAIEALLAPLDEIAAESPSACPGWSVADVVLHLAQTEEAVVATTGGASGPLPDVGSAADVDELMQRWVEAQRGPSFEELRSRWIEAATASTRAMQEADPDATLGWAAAPLKPRTLATTRLSEHWIHAHDIADPLGIDYPDTDRLWNIARLAHRTIPYAFARAGAEPPPVVRAELSSPQGERWVFGPEDAPCCIAGPAGEFCRIAARRLDPDDSSVVATGERATEVMALVRTYA